METWIVDRIKEPSTWAGIALGFVIIGMLTQAGWCMAVAGVCAVGAVLLKEKIFSYGMGVSNFWRKVLLHFCEYLWGCS